MTKQMYVSEWVPLPEKGKPVTSNPEQGESGLPDTHRMRNLSECVEKECNDLHARGYKVTNVQFADVNGNTVGAMIVAEKKPDAE